MVNRVPRGNKKGGQFAPNTIGKNAPTIHHSTKLSSLLATKAIEKLSTSGIGSANQKFAAAKTQNFSGNGIVLNTNIEKSFVDDNAKVQDTGEVMSSEVEDEAQVVKAKSIIDSTISQKAKVFNDSIITNCLVTGKAHLEHTHLVNSKVGGFFRSDRTPFSVKFRNTPNSKAARKAHKEANRMGLNVIGGVRLTKGYVYGNADIRKQSHIQVFVYNGIEYTRYRTKTGGAKRQYWYGARKPNGKGGWSVQLYYDAPPKNVQRFFN